MVSAFRGVIAPAADVETIAVVTPEPSTGLNDAPSSFRDGPLGAAFCVTAFMWSGKETSSRMNVLVCDSYCTDKNCSPPWETATNADGLGERQEARDEARLGGGPFLTRPRGSAVTESGV